MKSVPYAYAQCKHKNSKLGTILSKHAEHTHNELMMHISPKIKIFNLYFSPQVAHPGGLHGAKIMKIHQLKISHLGTFKGIA